VEALPQATPVKLDGEPLPPGQLTPLVPGARIELGDVRLTFHDADGFFERLSRLAATLTAQVSSARTG
jgi:hypothetical protein